MTLQAKTFIGAIWSFIDIIINKGLYFATTIILAGVLGPKEFGILGIIMVFVSIGNNLIDSGMSTSLMRMDNPTELDYSTVFYTGFSISLFVYILVFFFSPFIAEFYEITVLSNVLRIYCLGFFISPLKSLYIIRLSKQLDFKKISLLNIPGNIISVLIAVWLGFNGYGIWSLVWLFLVNQVLSTLLYIIALPKIKFMHFDKQNFKYHFNFGYKLLLSAQLNVFFENIYNLIIGKYYSIAKLGLYERAYTLNNYPVSVLSGIISKTTLPTFALIKNDLVRLKQAYRKTMLIAFFLSCFGLGYLLISAEQIFLIILGPEWMEAVPLFQILCLSFVFYPSHALNINILTLFGRSDLFLKLEIVKKIVIIFSILVGINFGLLGLVWANVFSSVVAFFVNTYYSGKFLNYNAFQQLLDLIPILLLAVTSLTLTKFFNQYSTINNYFLILFLNAMLVLISTIVIAKVFKLETYNIFKSLLKENLIK